MLKITKLTRFEFKRNLPQVRVAQLQNRFVFLYTMIWLPTFLAWTIYCHCGGSTNSWKLSFSPLYLNSYCYILGLKYIMELKIVEVLQRSGMISMVSRMERVTLSSTLKNTSKRIKTVLSSVLYIVYYLDKLSWQTLFTKGHNSYWCFSFTRHQSWNLSTQKH